MVAESTAGRIGQNYYPLRAQVRDELRARIGDGRLLPGQRLIEETLAGEFGVSRLPVREALRALESEGLVTTVPRKGVIVSTLSRTDVEHLYAVRRVLEVLTFGLVAASATGPQISRLSELVAQARLAASTDDHFAVVASNMEFHEYATAAAGNPFLINALEPLTSRLQWVIGHGYEHERDINEHQAIVDGIASHDREKVEALALSHIEAGRIHGLENFDRLKPQDEQQPTS